MKGKLIATVLFGAVLLAGCASKNPTIGDGYGTHWFDRSGPIKIEYTGQWQGNRPKGQGTARMVTPHYTKTCQGEFGLEPPDDAGVHVPVGQEVIDFGRGDVHMNGVLVFSGYFFSDLGRKFSASTNVCELMEGTMYSSFGGQKITGSFSGWTAALIEGPCKVQRANGEALIGGCSATDPGQVRAWSGRSKIDRVIDLAMFRDAEQSDYFRLVSGPGTYIDAAGTRYEGEINRSGVLTGLYKVTSKGAQAATRAQLVNGKIMAEFPLAETIVAQGKTCGAEQWLMMKGDCVNGAWSGAVDAYTADGLTNLRATFANGIATSEATIVSLEDGRTVRGRLSSPFDGEAALTRGQLLVGGVVEYDGEMQGLKPHGKGVCMFEGARESCEYFDGERIDPLFKMRQETRRATGANAPAGGEGVAAPAAGYAPTGQPAAPATAGSTAGAIAAECAKKFVALKACDRMPGLGANLCRAAANKKFSHLACSVIQ